VLGIAGILVFGFLAARVWNDEQPPSKSRPAEAREPPALSPTAVLALSTPDPTRNAACDAFIAAVPVPPGVKAEGEGLLHLILFARNDVAPIWQVPADQRDRLAGLFNACVATTDQPLVFPR
jgi:hypothetical protein